MLGWVGFPNLPEQYCSDKVLLLKCCEKLGKTLILTGGEASGGKLVRMCEEIDLDKPLVSSIPIGEHMQTVEDEGLHSICFRCGAYGHYQCQETCLNNLQPRSGSRGRGRRRGHGCSGGSSSEIDKIDALGRLLTRILRHMASELNLKMRSDGFVKVEDLLKLNLKTFANIWLRSHSVDDIRETVRRDNKQRLILMEENGELWIRANQGHTIMTVETDSLLKPILSAEEVPVCVQCTRDLQEKFGINSGTRTETHEEIAYPLLMWFAN
ncbi:hypothetical protein ACH5RR_000328 [Cinchona calisaya]|uniref:2'-phosphotransferase n=1 Tax=Cinchona calisaya TaxID=153742 RepID=A0ABD3B0A6_9GENT